MRLVLLSVCVGLCAGCAASRSPLAETTARLAAAATPEARAAVVAERLADTGAAPLASGRVRPFPLDVFAWGTPPVVAAFVPGQDPARRHELVTLATALDGPATAETIEAARRLVDGRPHGTPRRSVLVAFWPTGLTPDAGLARVHSVPVWPDTLRVATQTVGGDALLGLTGDALVEHLARLVRALADAPPPDSSAHASR